MDGTVVHGILNSFTDSVYTIDTDTLGTLRIAATKIKSIRSRKDTGLQPEEPPTLKERMANDPAIMDLIKSLQQDPDFQAILTDKGILGALASGNMLSLENNLKIQKLLNKPTLRQIEENLGQKP